MSINIAERDVTAYDMLLKIQKLVNEGHKLKVHYELSKSGSKKTRLT